MERTYRLYWRTNSNRSFLRELTDLDEATALYDKVAARPSTRLISLCDITDRRNIITIREK